MNGSTDPETDAVPERENDETLDTQSFLAAKELVKLEKQDSTDTEPRKHLSNAVEDAVVPSSPTTSEGTKDYKSTKEIIEIEAARAGGHHQRHKSDGSAGSSKKPRSLIGAVFFRSTEGGEATIRPVRSVHFNNETENTHGNNKDIFHEDGPEATWGDVGRACCCHSLEGWFHISIFFACLLFFLYFFLVGLDLLGTSFKVAGGCTAGSMLSSDTNPLASVMIGIIATALLQSSSTTTAIIVSLVSGGLDVHQGIYMVMGANVGTSVTAMLVSMAHMGDGSELERAFAGSSVQYVFKILTVILLLPTEIITQYLYRLTKIMLPSSVGEGESWEGPIKKIVSPLIKKIIIANKQLIDDISTGTVESCSSPGIYPVKCIDDIASYDTCQDDYNNTDTAIGVIGCDKDSGDCPLFFQVGASKKDDMVSGWVCMVVALTILIMCLIGLVSLLRKMLLGASTQVIYKATNINAYLAMLIGCGVTVLVQSSSITTSTLVPLAGVGVLNLEAMYPLVLGADVGTTFTAIMAAMVSSKVESLQIALVHLFFNITGIIIWYPIPFMRQVPLRTAKMIGKVTRHWRGFPLVFIVVMFFLMPMLLLGISACFEKKSIGFTALGSFLLILIFCGIAYFLMWWYFRDGKHKCVSCIERRQRRAAAIQALADDMDYIKVDTEWCKNEIGRIKDYASQMHPAVRMEEGRPPVSVSAHIDEETLATANEEDDRLSTFESCRSRPWKDVLFRGAGSIKSELQGIGSVH